MGRVLFLPLEYSDTDSSQASMKGTGQVSSLNLGPAGKVKQLF